MARSLANSTSDKGPQQLEHANIQAIILAGALQRDPQVLSRLPALLGAFSEGFRDVASIIVETAARNGFCDLKTLKLGIADRAAQPGASPIYEQDFNDALAAIRKTETLPGQAAAYCDVLEDHARKARREEFVDYAERQVKHGEGSLMQIAETVRKLAASYEERDGTQTTKFRTELQELLPYIAKLKTLQTGSEFLGLDSGFNLFNKVCNGLATGLTVLAAKPGAGKTTLVWQIACQVAKQKVPVIFLSLEQSKDELRAKALARFSQKLKYQHILRGRLQADDPDHVETLLKAAEEYGALAPYLTVIEGDETTTIAVLEQVARASMRQHGAKRCLVAVDYLQILSGDIANRHAESRASQKDRVDQCVSALRRLARSLNSPVLAISSQNRAGYGKKGMDVFKESGGIEYSADVALILTRPKEQPEGECCLVDLNVAKNRNGELGVIEFKFYAARGEFIEAGRRGLVEEEEDAE